MNNIEQKKENRRKKAREKLQDNPIEERKKRALSAKKWRAKHLEHSREVSRKRIDTGLCDKVLFYGYKEPLQIFTEGFGYKGVLSYSKNKDKVQCHFCGLLFKAINNGHLKKCHNLIAYEYKQKTGLSPQTALVGEGTRLKLIERPYNPNHLEELIKAQKKRRDIIKETGIDPQAHPSHRLEIKNRKGTCPDQLLDKIKKTILSYGRVPTEEEFLKFHHGKFIGSIRETYGTWTNALSKLGEKTNIKRYSREDLIKAMVNFYKVHKRTPRWSDMERGLLPSSSSYYLQFKNLNEARKESGVPVLIPAGRRFFEEVLIK